MTDCIGIGLTFQSISEEEEVTSMGQDMGHSGETSMVWLSQNESEGPCGAQWLKKQGNEQVLKQCSSSHRTGTSGSGVAAKQLGFQ